MTSMYQAGKPTMTNRMMRWARASASSLSAIMQTRTLPRAQTTGLLAGKIPIWNVRYRTFLRAFTLMTERRARVIVETGTARGGSCNCRSDGCSTLLFAQWANRNDARVYSVDIDGDALDKVMRDLAEYRGCAELHHGDSVTFLRQFERTIDFLYLDSYDYDDREPEPSQRHHLHEIEAALPRLSNDGVVMIDDCDFPNGGKGKLAIAYLRDRGWRVDTDGYQVILLKR